jgi:hypothetical protein
MAGMLFKKNIQKRTHLVFYATGILECEEYHLNKIAPHSLDFNSSDLTKTFVFCLNNMLFYLVRLIARGSFNKTCGWFNEL